MSTQALFRTEIPGLECVHRGKVRDLFALGEDRLLMVASDRLSAFDVVLPDPIPGKGEILCQLSNFWFARFADRVPNHLTGTAVAEVLPPGVDAAALDRRSVVVRRLKPLPVEAIVRGYLIGSGWKEYEASGSVCGIRLPERLPLAGQLPEPIFTPSTKAAVGAHDQNIGFDTMVAQLGGEIAETVRSLSLDIYRQAAAYAAGRGILIADTKFEFGLDEHGRVRLMDELLTPDSSRFWPAEAYRPGISPPSYDKQYVRDWLQAQHWNKRPPAPRLPAEIIAGTARRYAQALQALTA